MRIKKGRDLKAQWILTKKDGSPAELPSDITLIAYQKNKPLVKISPHFTIIDNHIIEYFIPNEALDIGEYILEISFSIPDSSIPSGIFNEEIDLCNAFTIVKHTCDEDPSSSSSLVSSAMMVKGDKGDVEYATFYLDHITGCLKMIYDPSFNNVSFSIKNGNLILEINTL